MVKVNFLEADGTRREIEARPGQSLRDAALEAGIEGIAGLCGGYCNCGTCHAYVAQAWLSRLPPVSAEEDAMLDGTASERRPDSRLCCQIRATEDLEGIVLTLPPQQT